MGTPCLFQEYLMQSLSGIMHDPGLPKVRCEALGASHKVMA
jgi:hypothetical protein